MNKKIKHHIQSVLVPISQFNNVEQAQSHVHELGYNTSFKKPHKTENYYRFRQYDPEAGQMYRTINLNKSGTKAIVAEPIYNGIQPRHKKMLGEDGHGIYNPKYHNQIQPKGNTHEQFSVRPLDRQRQKIIEQRFRMEQKNR